MARTQDSRARAPISRIPLFLMLWGITSLSMFVPAAVASLQDHDAVARAFTYAAVLGLVLVTMIQLAMGGRAIRFGVLGQLLALFATFAVLPLFLALPLHDALRTTTYLNAYFDMVSALTTTGADIFADPDRLVPALHLWRAQVAWLGGLLMWIAAAAILAPMSLGGFEVTTRGEPGRADPGAPGMQRADPYKRLMRIGAALAPIYAVLTVALLVLLLIAGEAPLPALCHAMSVMATSGLSPLGGVEAAGAGRVGEVMMACFMIFALSRLTFSRDTVTSGRQGLMRDPELRVAALIVTGVPLILVLRHWIGAYDLESGNTLGEALRALWGGVFTVLSFLTTTGFVSADWQQVQNWSGLETSGLILLGLALIGGGVATTAGGVKLLRVYALYLNGLREMERLVYPSSVSTAAPANRRLQRDGAFIAWIFFMLFAMSLAAVTMLLAAFGVGFEDAVILSIAAISTTGPLTEIAGDAPIRLVELAPAAKVVLCGAMVLGRLETLAIIALLTPDLWRN